MRYKKCKTSSLDIVVPENVGPLRDMLENVLGYTYPTHILERRIRLLNAKDRKKLKRWETSLEVTLEEIDRIISDRAEEEQDPWV